MKEHRILEVIRTSKIMREYATLSDIVQLVPSTQSSAGVERNTSKVEGSLWQSWNNVCVLPPPGYWYVCPSNVIM